MKLCPNFANKESCLSPTNNQFKFGEIKIITSPIPQKSKNSSPPPQLLIKPIQLAHKSNPSNEYNNSFIHPLTPKQRMNELGVKVEKNLNKRLPPVPIKHLDNGTGYELKGSEFPKFGFRTGLDKMYSTKCSSSPQLNRLNSKPSQGTITTTITTTTTTTTTTTNNNNLKVKTNNLIQSPGTPLSNTLSARYTKNPPPPLNLLSNNGQKFLLKPKKISITKPTTTHNNQRSNQLDLVHNRNPSDLSGFISNFKNTLPEGEDSDTSSHIDLSPTKFDWIKNMEDNMPLVSNNRKSFAIQGNNNISSDLSGLDETFAESFNRSLSSPVSYASTTSSSSSGCDSDTNSEHSLITPKEDTTNSPLSQTLDILCGGDTNNSGIVEVNGQEALHIPLSDIAKANLGKWSQLRERKLTRRGYQVAGLGSSQRNSSSGRLSINNDNNAQPVGSIPLKSQLRSKTDNPPTSITFASNIQDENRKKLSLEDSNLSYDLSGLLESYKYPRHRAQQSKGYEIHDDLSSILNLYLDPELLSDPPALSTVTSKDCEEEDIDEVNDDDDDDTFDEVKSSLGVLERIHQGLKLTSGSSELNNGELSDQDYSRGDVIDLYFPDLVYCQSGGNSQH